METITPSSGAEKPQLAVLSKQGGGEEKEEEKKEEEEKDEC